jgi:hypothetical protein
MNIIEERKQHYTERIQKGLHSLRVKGDLGTTLGLTSSFNELAKLELYTNKKSASQAKRYLFKAARAYQLYQWYVKDMYMPEHVDSDPKNPFIGPVISEVQLFLLCDHNGLEMGYYADIEVPARRSKHDGFCMALAYIHLLRNNIEDAREALGDAYKKGDMWTKDFALILGGIVHQDISLVEKGLDFRRKETLRINNGVFPEDILISDRATAWVKLARQFGLEPDTSKGMIHEKILEHEDMEFEDIDEVYEAIGLEPIKRYPLRNY